MKTRHYTVIGSLVLAAALGLTGCASPGDSSALDDGISIDDAPTPTTTPSPNTSQQPEPTPETTPSQEMPSPDLHETTQAALDAINLAESDTGGLAYQLSDDDDETTWELDLNVNGDEVEVHVNWAGTEVLRTERDDRVDGDILRKLDAATVTMQETIIVASAHAGGYVGEVELDSDNGVVVWEITFEDRGDDWSVDVHAQTGDIIKADRD